MTTSSKIYLVGGAVRDELLKREVKEYDWVVVGSTPDELLKQGFKSVGKDFPVFLHPKTKEEYALARKERKTAPGYHGFEFQFDPNVTLEEDLSRRDLTVNAIAKDENGNLVDPYGGVKDLENKTLRHVSDAFAEDPVRILRIARFYARFYHLGFKIAPETNELMINMVRNGEVHALTPERVWKELEKALGESNPEQFFYALKDCEALQIILPEIFNLFGVPQRADYHPEIDAGIHTMMVLQQAVKLSNDLTVRFAALVHDLGKANTPKTILPSHHGHEQRGARIIKEMCDRLRIPNSFRELAVKVAEYHIMSHRFAELKPSTIVKTLKNIDAFRRPEVFNNFLITCEADARGRKGFENTEYSQKDSWQKCFLACKDVAKNESKNLMEQGFTGEKLGNKIFELQVAAVKPKTESAS